MTGDHPDLPYEIDVKFTCSFCWQQFDSAVALLEHEALEDDQLYDFEIAQDPSTNAATK